MIRDETWSIPSRVWRNVLESDSLLLSLPLKSATFIISLHNLFVVLVSLTPHQFYFSFLKWIMMSNHGSFPLNKEFGKKNILLYNLWERGIQDESLPNIDVFFITIINCIIRFNAPNVQWCSGIFWNTILSLFLPSFPFKTSSSHFIITLFYYF